METRASYTLIGAFTLLVFLSAFGFVLWIGKVSLDREWDYYDIVFKEAVTGLSVGGAVQYNGIQIGEVRKLSLAPNDPRQVIAHVRLNGDTPVRTDTKARLTLLGLTGVTVIQLSGGTPSAPRLQPALGETVPRIVAGESAMQSLLASGQDIAVSANDTLVRVNRLLSDDNMNHVASALAHIDEVTSVLADQRTELRTLIGQLSTASAQLKSTLSRIDTLAASGDRLINQQSRQVLESAQRAIDSANAILDQNRAPAASFSNEGLSQVGPALGELRQTLQSLRVITTRLQNDPTTYLLGGERVREFEPK
jgi:phospholipid/cholesterol/gamma-HCH transport system substrate-binding protein